jgi:hypothetical protein
MGGSAKRHDGDEDDGPRAGEAFTSAQAAKAGVSVRPRRSWERRVADEGGVAIAAIAPRMWTSCAC